MSIYVHSPGHSERSWFRDIVLLAIGAILGVLANRFIPPLLDNPNAVLNPPVVDANHMPNEQAANETKNGFSAPASRPNALKLGIEVRDHQ